jgi:acetylserotonin N-methyltransferase
MRYTLPGPEDRAIWDIWLSMYHLPAMAVADELHIFEQLARGPTVAADVARDLELNPRAVEIVLCMLAALGLLRSNRGHYELAELARTYLLPDSPNYWGPLLRSLGVVQGPHAALLAALKASHDGEESRSHPAEAWARGEITAELAERVTRGMHCHSLPAAAGAARSGVFDGVTRLLDVGGGSGCFSIAIAQQFPRIRCTIAELPAVCEAARKYIADGGVAERVDALPIDMFRDTWPAGYDAVFFSNVFHDWAPTTNRRLAGAAFDALAPGGRILLHEMLMAEEKDGPLTTASFAVLMLLGTPGKQYTLGELTVILEAAGFSDVSATPSYGYYSIVSAVKA